MITIEEYFHTSFEHDAEFVEGRIIGRTGTFWEHCRIQGFLTEELRPLSGEFGCHAVLEVRVRRPISALKSSRPTPQTVETLEKVREYLPFGVPWVWAIDPVTRLGHVHGPNGITAVDNQIFFTDRFEIDLNAAEV